MRKNLFLTSMPRSGTHLVEAILTRLTGRTMARIRKPNIDDYPAVAHVVARFDYREFAFLGHIRYFPDKPIAEVASSPHWSTIVLIRDPRDIALSLRDAFEVTKTESHAQAFAPFKASPRREQIRHIMNGIPFAALPIEQHCAGWLEWAEQGATLVRFEEVLSGEAACSIARALHMPEEDVTAAIGETVGKPTLTLNRGKGGRWRAELDKELIELFKDRTGSLVERMGYSW